jgi:hypothetical protein
MSSTPWLKSHYLIFPLVALMAFTRISHFGDAYSLPDASLAVFFLAGLRFSQRWFLALLIIEAGLIDFVAITQFSVDAYCISLAYVFLIPTYAVMWYAGRVCEALKSLSTLDMLKTLSAASLATTVAFILSNGSFYLFSGKFADLTLFDYTSRVIKYYPAYASAALLYALAGLITAKTKRALPFLHRHEPA